MNAAVKHFEHLAGQHSRRKGLRFVTTHAAAHLILVEEIMRADRVEISWDNEKSKWLIRIEAGDEVLRRHCDLPRNADETALRAAAQKTVADEGYGAAASSVILRM